jgi:SAM-dependent methyltransferase
MVGIRRAGDRAIPTHLPLEDASVDAVICECAFCTFPDKPAAAREFARVLRPGGRVGLGDLTRVPGALPGLDDLMAWIVCLADARPAEAYAALLADAGLTRVATERHDHVLTEMIRDIDTRLFAAEVFAGLEQLDLTGIDLHAAKRMIRQALKAVAEEQLGYALVSAIKPSGPPRAVQMVSGF